MIQQLKQLLRNKELLRFRKSVYVFMGREIGVPAVSQNFRDLL